MIDIHSHILPELDDGAESVEDSLQMARMAVESGVRAMLATPHSPSERHLSGAASLVEAWVRRLQHIFREEGIALRLFAGMEIFVTDSTPRLLAEGQLLTLAGSRYALVEFAFDEAPQYIVRMLRDIARAGFVPIVAHPERYYCAQDDTHCAAAFCEAGGLLQINKDSLLLDEQSDIRTAAEGLLAAGLVYAVASDTHSPFRRTPDMTEVAKALCRLTSPETAHTLLSDNPRRILADQPALTERSF